MTRIAFVRLTLILLVALTASCGYDTAAPGTYDPPATDPPGENEPPGLPLIEGLWTVAGSESAIYRLAPAQLLASGAISAATTVTTSDASLFTLNAVAFDDTGTLWITSREDSLVLAFGPAALGASGNREATTLIAPTAGSLSGPTGLAFDRRHRLWVANFDNGTIVRFDSAQLASRGAPVPTRVLRSDHATAIAFDAAGDLWVSESPAHIIVKFSSAQLESPGNVLPEVTLIARDGSLYFPAGLAFDPAGNLWVANSGNQTVVAFSQADLAATGSPAPRVKLSSNAGSIQIPTGLAFDNGGSLWVVSADGGLDKFSGADLTTSGAPQPRIHVQLNDDLLFWSLAFWPKPRGLPLN